MIYGYAPMIRSFVYRAFVSCIVRSFRVSCVRSFAFSVQFVRFISFVRSCIVRFSYRSCDAFARFPRTYQICVAHFEDLLDFCNRFRGLTSFVAHYEDLLDFCSTLRGLARLSQHITSTYKNFVAHFEDLLVLQHITRTYWTFVTHSEELLEFCNTFRGHTRLL